MKKSLSLIALFGSWFLTHSVAGIVSINNDSVKVSYDDSAGNFTITSPASPLKITGTLPVTGTASVSTEPDKVFGAGQSILVKDAQNQTARIILFPHTPFVVFRHSFANLSAQPETLNKVPALSFSPDFGQPLSGLKIRAYSGLSDATKANPGAGAGPADATKVNPGAGTDITDPTMVTPGAGSGPANAAKVNLGDYEWLAVADPATRAGIVTGFISQLRSTGVIVRSVEADKLTLSARSEYGRLLLDPGQTAESESFAIGIFPDVRLGLESYADQLAKTYQIKLPAQPSGYCTWYSGKQHGPGDEKSLAELGAFISTNLKPFGMNFVQIDDGWQLGGGKNNGPHKNFTQFNPKGPYASGMKATADNLKALGLTPGIWFMPFAGTYDDPWFADKTDLFVKDKDGKPFDTKWGGTCLDMTNPATQDYVKKEVAQISHDWGYTYFKMDGFWTGLADTQIYINTSYKETDFGSAVFHDPHKTNIEALRIGINLVRQAAGPDVFFLGCCVNQNMRSYGGSFGTLDAMRIGPDNGGTLPHWLARSPVFGSRTYFLNGRLWYNDPDPCYVSGTLTLDQARLSPSWTAISGQLYTVSEWLPDLSPERLDIVKRTVAPHGKTARPVDFLQNDPPCVWQVTDDQATTRRDVVALYNFTANPKTIEVAIRDLDLPKAQSYAAFDFWSGHFLPDFTDTITMTLPPTSCQIIAVRPMMDHPFVISTSRHVTQGMIDLVDETWDAATQTLSGKSQVITGDPYEIRIVLPDHYKNPTASHASVEADSASTITMSNTDGCRATISSKTTGQVNWHIQFETAK